MNSNSPSSSPAMNRIAPELSESIAGRIHEATDEALQQEDTIARVTVIRGYLHLSMAARKTKYIRKLSVAIAELAEFVMERGRPNLARRLLILADELRRSSLTNPT
jgi:hypothetical protein